MDQLSEPAIPPHRGSMPTARTPPRRLRYRVEYGFYWCLAKFAAALPLELCAAWSGWCWLAAARTFQFAQSTRLAQLAQSLPELSDEERKTIVNEVWDNLGRVFAEGFHLSEFIDHPERYEMTREAELTEFIARSERFIAVSLHSANWELVALGALRTGLRLAGIYQTIKNPFVDAYVKRLREPLYAAALLPKSRALPRRLIQADARRRDCRHDVRPKGSAWRRSPVLR
jgi:Kdo2-lipid IVA lauroyltransferase/acyltransferase